jgi:hypothetical protein
MFRTFIDRFRTSRRVAPAVAEPAQPLPTASVEAIWSSWRYEEPAVRTTTETQPRPQVEPRPKSTNLAERVNQLKRLGEYEKALEVALAEVARDEQEGPPATGSRAMVPWYYWEAATIYRRLKRYDDEIALIRRFARNHGIHFRAFSKRYRSTHVAQDAWAIKFLERLETAKAASTGSRPEDAH